MFLALVGMAILECVVESVDGIGLLPDACLGVNILADIKAMAELFHYGFSFDAELAHEAWLR